MPAPEGSDERRIVRAVLSEHARLAHRQGCSYDGWLEREDVALLDAVDERDLRAIFFLTWRKKRR